nr:hypothetical protein CFP56_02589 [Quercus suber]
MKCNASADDWNWDLRYPALNPRRTRCVPRERDNRHGWSFVYHEGVSLTCDRRVSCLEKSHGAPPVARPVVLRLKRSVV